MRVALSEGLRSHLLQDSTRIDNLAWEVLGLGQQTQPGKAARRRGDQGSGIEGWVPAHQTGKLEDSVNRTVEEEPKPKTPPAGGKTEGAEAPTIARVREATRAWGRPG